MESLATRNSGLHRAQVLECLRGNVSLIPGSLWFSKEFKKVEILLAAPQPFSLPILACQPELAKGFEPPTL